MGQRRAAARRHLPGGGVLKTAPAGKSLLVCFAGIDGSGKSTQARLLRDWLESKGLKTSYVWNIFNPWFLGPMMAVARPLFLRGKDRFRDYDEYRQAREKAFQRTRLTAFFHNLFFWEYLVRFAPRVRFLLARRRIVLCDRYLYDAVVGHAANLHYSDDKIRDTVRFLLRFMPRPDIILLIDTPEEIAFRRKNDVPSVGYLRDRRSIYLRLAADYHMTQLDGSRGVDEIQKDVRDAVEGYLSCAS